MQAEIYLELIWLSEWKLPYKAGSRQLIGSRHLIPPGLPRAIPLPSASCPSCSHWKTRGRNELLSHLYVAERLQCLLELPQVNTQFPSQPDMAQTLAHVVPALGMRMHWAWGYILLQKSKCCSPCWIFTTDLQSFLEELRETRGTTRCCTLSGPRDREFYIFISVLQGCLCILRRMITG